MTKYWLLPAFCCFSFFLSAQILQPGDLAIVGVNANNVCANNAEDLVSFVVFKDIESGFSIQVTDNGWERQNAGLFGNTEGTLDCVYSGPTIPAGEVITFEFNNNPVSYQCISHGGWSLTEINGPGGGATTDLNLNNGGDQLFFLSGGTWNSGTIGSHNASYSGNFLFGFTTSGWLGSAPNGSDAGTKESRLPPELTPCFNMNPTGSTDYSKYTGPDGPATQREWIARISDAGNWTSYPDCGSYNSAAPNYPAPVTLPIASTETFLECNDCDGCGTVTATITVNLPSIGGPFTIEYSDNGGATTTTLSGLNDGSTFTVTYSSNTTLQIVSVTAADGCPLFSDLGDPVTITVDGAPAINPIQIGGCTNPDGSVSFDLNSFESAIASGTTNTVNWFTDAALNNPIPEAQQGNYTTSASQLYATVESPDGCESDPVSIGIVPQNGPVASDAAITACDQSGQGGATVDLTSVSNDISGGNGTVSFFANPSATAAINNPSSYVTGGGFVYAQVDDGGPCASNVATITITIETAPAINISGNPQVCPGGSVDLSDFASAGATPVTVHSSDPPTPANEIPATVSPGSTTTYYLLADGSGDCDATSQITVQVVPAVPPSISTPPDFCSDDAAYNLNLLFNGPMVSGTWTGNGVSGGSIFDPSAGSGSQLVTFNSSDPCYLDVSFTIDVGTSETVSLTAGTSLCSSDGLFNLNNLFSSTPVAGIWTGTGVSGSNFDPSGQAGQTINVTFLPSDNCTNSATTDITVSTSAMPTLGTPPASVCSDDGLLDLTIFEDPAFPSGTWTGPGVSGSNFDPAAQSGPVSLTFTPAAACAAAATLDFSVLPAATPTLGTASSCSDGLVDLSTLLDTTYPTGTWTGDGVSGTTFSASGLSGMVTLSFASDENCVNEATTTISVADPLVATNVVADCGGSTTSYTVSFDIDGGGASYTVDGTPVAGTTFTSDPIPTGVAYSFEVDGALGCGPLTVSGDAVICACPPVFATVEGPICETEAIFVNGTLYDFDNPTGQEIITDGSVAGCDSIVNVDLDFYTPSVQTISPTLCPGEVYVFNTIQFDETNPNGSVTIPNADPNGCDSTYTIALQYLTLETLTIDTALCTGQTLTVGGQVFDATNLSGLVQLPGAGSNGCALEVTVLLSYEDDVSFDLDDELCTGQSVIVNGTTYNAANPNGTETFTNGSYLGCDSIVNVALTFNDAVSFDLDDELCTGQSVIVNGTTYDAANPTGTETFTNGSYLGCDSIVNVALTFNDAVSFDLDDELCTGQNVIVNGTTYDAANPTGTETFTNGSYLGCDSIVNVALTFNDAVSFDLDDELCTGQSVIVNGTTYNAANPSGTETFINGSVAGCDSIVNIDLSFFPPAQFFLTEALCVEEQVIVNGTVYDQFNPSGTEVLAEASYTGCDSTVFVNLDFSNQTDFNLEQDVCDDFSIVINGTVYDVDNPTGTEVLTGASYQGCDSTINVNLSFTNAVNFDLSDLLCPDETVLVNGIVYSAANPSGLETFPGGSYLGCDSTVTVDLNFYTEAVFNLTDQLCAGESMIVNGTVYDATNPSGTETLPGAAFTGCDSTINVLLDFALPVVFNLDDALCEGDGILVNGILYDQDNPSGSELFAGAAANGCDSTVVVELSFLPTATSTISETLLPDESILVGGMLFDQDNPSGSVTLPGAAANGCDSMVTVNLTFVVLNVQAIGIAPTCFGEADARIELTALAGGTPPYEIQLNEDVVAVVDALPVVLPVLDPGVYELTIRDADGAITKLTVPVAEAQELILQTDGNYFIQLGDSVLIAPQVNFAPDTWVWSPAATLNCDSCATTIARPMETTVYELTATDKFGCTVTTAFRVEVDREIHVFVPNAFSPNGDGINDVLRIFAGTGIERIHQFRVFDRWGETMFVATDFSPGDTNVGWRGDFRGQAMSPAVFVWTIEVELSDGRREMLSGDVLLTR